MANKNKEKNFVSAIIYVHNAENKIEDFLKTIICEMEDNFEHSEIICVNDCSNDNSVNIIKKISTFAETASVSILNMSYFHGLEIAMNAGVDLSIGDFVFEFDNTDLNFDKSEIMNIYRRSLLGYDIVNAVPNKKEKLSSRIFYKIFEKFTDLSYELHTESFRILSRRVINRISSMNRAVPYRKVIYASCGLRADSIKYDVIKADADFKDKREKKYRKRLAVDSLILFTGVGYCMSIAMTMMMIMIIIAAIIYTIIAYSISSPVSGWTSTILFLSVVFLGVFAVLTIVIKYLQLLVDLVFKRKRYSFESVEKLTK